MNITPFTVYLIMIADSVNAVILVACILLGLVLGFAFLIEKSENEDIFKNAPKKTLWSTFIALVVLVAAFPTTKTLCAVVVIPALANSQAIQKDFPELYDLAITKLKDKLKPNTETK